MVKNPQQAVGGRTRPGSDGIRVAAGTGCAIRHRWHVDNWIDDQRRVFQRRWKSFQYVIVRKLLAGEIECRFGGQKPSAPR